MQNVCVDVQQKPVHGTSVAPAHNHNCWSCACYDHIGDLLGLLELCPRDLQDQQTRARREQSIKQRPSAGLARCTLSENE